MALDPPLTHEVIIAAIRDGRLDEHIRDLQAALHNRQTIRQQALLAQVQAVYGPNAEITIKR